MIQIKVSNLDKLADKYYKKIEMFINQKNTKYKLDDINCDLLSILNKDLEQIVTAKPNELRKLIAISPSEFSNTIEQLKDLYGTFRDKWGVELIEDLKMDVCPFCNRNYIFKFQDSIKEEARILATLDHYYDKDSYPFLSVSFFNLIPSCNICNSKFKHIINFSKIKHLHPYEDDFNKRAKFSHFLKPINNENKNNTLFSKERIALTLTSIDEEDIPTKNTISTFRLNDIYQEHKNTVLELIQKREIYPDSYIDELAHNYSGLFTNREDLLRLITCGYVNDEDINKRPLSKLIKDISEELKLI